MLLIILSLVKFKVLLIEMAKASKTSRTIGVSSPSRTSTIAPSSIQQLILDTGVCFHPITGIGLLAKVCKGGIVCNYGC